MKKKLVLVLLAVMVVIGMLFVDNEFLSISRYSFSSSEVPEEFDGFTIVQLSDLHGRKFRFANIAKKVREENPQMIVITGDLIDKQDTSLEKPLALVEELIGIAPVYFINGNHENANESLRRELHRKLVELGATVLVNESINLARGDSAIHVMGLDDAMSFIWNYDDGMSVMAQQIKALKGDGLNILLAHHPEYLETYESVGVDLVFSGHAHGGQFRFPGLGGLYAPGQGFFPKYTSGIYVLGKTAMVVNRGLGNSVFPFRIFNRPEITVVKLRHQKG